MIDPLTKIKSFNTFSQINDAITAFIGGTSNPKGITTFDWSTMTHQKISANFIENRTESGCALITTSTGEKLVAVVGGKSIFKRHRHCQRHASSSATSPSTLHDKEWTFNQPNSPNTRVFHCFILSVQFWHTC